MDQFCVNLVANVTHTFFSSFWCYFDHFYQTENSILFSHYRREKILHYSVKCPIVQCSFILIYQSTLEFLRSDDRPQYERANK